MYTTLSFSSLHGVENFICNNVVILSTSPRKKTTLIKGYHIIEEEPKSLHKDFGNNLVGY